MIRGSLEIITNPHLETAASVGLPVQAMDPDLVPALLAAVYGLAEVTEIDPDPGQVATWTAVDPQLRPVRCVLWQEPDIDQTLIGSILAMIAEEGGDT